MKHILIQCGHLKIVAIFQNRKLPRKFWPIQLYKVCILELLMHLSLDLLLNNYLACPLPAVLHCFRVKILS